MGCVVVERGGAVERLCVVSEDDLVEDRLAALGSVGWEVTRSRGLFSEAGEADWVLIDLRDRGRQPLGEGFRAFPFGRYLVLGELGRGMFGRVVEALNTETNERVALKLPSHELLDDPTVNARFVREVFALARVDSPYVCRYVDNGLVGQRLYLAMELVEGPTLEEHVRERGGLSEAEVRGLLEGLAQAVRALHREGLVHRDIKPANVILRGGNVGRPVLADFGLVRPAESSALTSKSVVLGSPGYVPPEYLLEDVFEPAGDLFAVGMVARYALTGAHYKCGLAPFQLLTDMAKQEVEVPEVPLAEVVRALVRHDPSERLESGTALLQRLEA